MSWFKSRSPPATSILTPARDQTLEALVARHYGLVWRVLRGAGLSPADADDAAQQVFMIAARKLESIAPERERSFLYGTARRVANNARRGLRRRRELPGDDIELTEAEEVGPEQSTESTRARAFLSELLDRLPDDLRRVLVLAEVEELPVSEIAELEGLPVGTATSRLRRARERFRALLVRERARNPYGGHER